MKNCFIIGMLVFFRMIADGDSSVYNSVLEARPYKNLTVVKIECRNHMLRNYTNKLKDITTTSIRKEASKVDRGLHLKMRRILGGRSSYKFMYFLAFNLVT